MHPLSQLSPTHPLSLHFTRWPSLGSAQLPGEARPGKTESGEARFEKPQSQPLSSQLQVFYGACSESAREGNKTVNLKGLLFTPFWRPDMLF